VSRRKPKLYRMSEYMMIMHELEKARLAGRARKRDRTAESVPRKSPSSKAGSFVRRLARRR
jgi:hypothetical protein